MNERDDPLLTPKEAAKDLKKSVSFPRQGSHERYWP
jgi:hypothetical protein